MMTPPDDRRQPVRCLLLALLLLLPSTGAAEAQAPSLQLSNAPVRLEYPEPWREWAVRLAGYADAAAASVEELVGAEIPAGTIRWEPAASGPGSGADGVVEVHRGGGGTVVIVRTNIPLLVEDFGAAYALGYGRWLGAYAIGRIALGAPGEHAPWWTEGAALYLTHRLFRDARTTTPVLYGIESNYVRAAQTRRPVDLSADTLSAAARGKAYATFKLLEALYGPDAVARAVGRLVERPSPELATMVDAIGRERTPDPDALLRDWLEPTVSLDLILDDVDLENEGARLEAKVKREGPIPLPVLLEVRLADGQAVIRSAPPGRDDVRLTVDLPAPATAVVLDPAGLIPDVNRANNRQGFGDADNIRRFFTFDEYFELDELDFSGEIHLDEAEQRTEEFRLRVTNLTEEQTGVGFLVSAQWVDRPARVQRAFYLPLAPGETRIVEETFAYPNRGTGRARVEARFWRAEDIDDLNSKLLAVPPGSRSNYILLRDAPEAPRRPSHTLFRQPPEITPTEGVVSAPPREPAGPQPDRAADGNDAGERGEEDAEVFAIDIRSPGARDVPVGDTVLAAEITGPMDAERVDFYVNERKVGAVLEPPFRLRWSYPENEQVFVIRAVAQAGDRIASDEVVLDRADVTFGASVNLVTLHVTVRDGAGRIVRGLTAEDFRVVEGSVEQEIVQADFGEVPVSAALLLDQSSSMIGGGIRAERAGAERLIQSLVSDVNRVMVLGFNDQVYVYARFTSDAERLTSALTAVDPDGATALFDTLAEAVRKVNRHRGKRALVVLSDGLDTNSEFAFEDVVEYLRQTDVLVYTIGLQLMHEGTALGDVSGAVKDGIEQLRTFAESTGGASYFPLALEELEEIYGRIAEELGSQYSLSYYPRNQSWNGQWRELQVRVPGHPEYTVQAREGYYGVAPGRR